MISTTLIGLSAQDSVSTDPSTYGADDESPYQSYISNTDVKPLELLVTTAKNGTADGYVFLGIDGDPSSGQNIPCIYGKLILESVIDASTITNRREYV